MAHLGKFYKVQFRRDLHLDSQNSFGYPECFSIALANLSTPFGNFDFSDRFLCKDLLTDAQPPMVWTSDFQTFHGRSWRLRWTLDNPAVTIHDTVHAHYRLEESVAGVVLDYSVDFAIQFYSSVTLNANLGAGTLATGYSWTNFFCTFDCGPATWSVYP